MGEEQDIFVFLQGFSQFYLFVNFMLWKYDVFLINKRMLEKNIKKDHVHSIDL